MKRKDDPADQRFPFTPERQRQLEHLADSVVRDGRAFGSGQFAIEGSSCDDVVQIVSRRLVERGGLDDVDYPKAYVKQAVRKESITLLRGAHRQQPLPQYEHPGAHYINGMIQYD